MKFISWSCYPLTPIDPSRGWRPKLKMYRKETLASWKAMQTGKITYLTNTLENSPPFTCQPCNGAPQLRIPLSLRTTKQLHRCFVAKLRNATGSRMSGFRLLAIEDLGFSLIPRPRLNEYSTAELNVYDKRLTNKSR